MRLFVAVEIGPAIASAAATLVDELRRRAARLASDAKVTWIPSERLHLTVRFIGNVDEDAAQAIAAALAPPVDVPPFTLAIAGIGTFPKSGPARVIWAAVSEGLDGLELVERDVTRRLERAGVAPDDRPYRPHLTLARVRPPSRERFGAAGASELTSAPLLEGVRDTVLGAAQVEAITLFESRLSPQGPAYVALQHTPLTS